MLNWIKGIRKKMQKMKQDFSSRGTVLKLKTEISVLKLKTEISEA